MRRFPTAIQQKFVSIDIHVNKFPGQITAKSLFSIPGIFPEENIDITLRIAFDEVYLASKYGKKKEKQP